MLSLQDCVAQEINKETFGELLDEYASRLPEFRSEELYKWEAAEHFREVWNPDAEDFAAMLDDALSGCGNLLVGSMWYPKKMLTELAEFEPETVRAAFAQTLFNDNISLLDRLGAFSSIMSGVLDRANARKTEEGEKPAQNHYQDPRSMSVYLTCWRPEEYPLYKSSMYLNLVDELGLESPSNKFEKVVACQALYKQVAEFVGELRPELIEQSNGLLGEDLAALDSAHMLLAQDIAYYCEYWREKPDEAEGTPSAELEEGQQSFALKYENQVGNTELSENRSCWMYSPGEGACAWYDCVCDGIMVLGWDQLGDFDQYGSREELEAALADKAGDGKSQSTNSLACWEFQAVMKPGDIVYAKRGCSFILGRGEVKSGPYYDQTAERYKHVRKVEWTDFGEWEVPSLPRKTLTCWDNFPDDVKRVEDAINGKVAGDESRSYWWLVGKESNWSFDYFDDNAYEWWTAYNENGNKRRVFKNIQAVRKGDKFVGYHSYPTQKAVCTVEALSDFMGLGPKEDQGFWIGNRVRASKPVTYEQMKNDPVLCQMDYLAGNPTGCCFELTKEQYERLVSLMGINEVSAPPGPAFDPYTDEDFLSDVFMGRADFEDLKTLAKVKKNVILQGSPGTGKTFAAERLAWALMGCKDANRVEKVQFHQNTSYDEFVIGFRPNAQGGFEIKEGPFVRFCERAAADPEGREHFFIIDEINRANVSKVFGELLMLIEADHRGECLRLAIDDRRFAVPKNVTVIGMMNTADRGLALIDYALRRRFAFFEMEPALDNANFKKMVEACPDKRMPALVKAVCELNKHIAEDPSLDEGFRIGHSYFCRSDEGCVDSIIKYELAPLIREYWFDDRKKANDEIKALKEAVE